MDAAVPPLSPFYQFLAPHAFACRVVECRRPIAWIDWTIAHVVGLGWCHEHRPRGRMTPITIYGGEGDGWWSWPAGVSVAALDRALARRRS